jgi:hypothetical protein
MSKQWIYRNGDKPFSVTEIVMPGGEMRYVSATKSHGLRTHRTDGSILAHGYNELDLIPYEPYSDYEIDDKVNCWDDDNGKVESGHFAGLMPDGKPTTFQLGGTSFTRHNLQIHVWNFCEKANKEDK